MRRLGAAKRGPSGSLAGGPDASSRGDLDELWLPHVLKPELKTAPTRFIPGQLVPLSSMFLKSASGYRGLAALYELNGSQPRR